MLEGDINAERQRLLEEIATRVESKGYVWTKTAHSDAAWQSVGLAVLVSVEDHGSDGVWLHVSVSRRDKRLPNYYTIAKVKRLFIGDDRGAVEFYPATQAHVNLLEARHLWSCLTGDRTYGMPGEDRCLTP